MEKRLLLAITLSLALLLSWSALQKKSQPNVSQDVNTPNTAVTSEAIPLPQAASFQIPELEAETFMVRRGDISLEFIESLGVLKGAVFHNYRDYVYRVDAAIPADMSMKFHRILADDPNAVHFRYEGEQQTITKSYIFDNSLYGMRLSINVQNHSAQSYVHSPSFAAGILRFIPNNPDSQYASIVFSTAGKLVHISGHKPAAGQEIDFLALRDRYFCFIVEPEFKPSRAVVSTPDKQTSIVELDIPSRDVPAGASAEYVYQLYLGPQDIKVINVANHDWTAIIHYGPFDIISHLLLQILGVFYSLVHNWGISIILLSFVTYIILFPLSIKQIRSMKEMQKLQPHIENLRKTYKDNPQKLNKEIMELYRAHKVNPLSGCLPILLQMPIFFALYPVLMRSAFLRGADFLWIKDLSSPDRIATLPIMLPVLKDEVNLLPVLLAILMFLQQRATLKSTAVGAQADQQKMMMYIMPVMFGFIFYHMPAGLVLYWLVNSILMFVFQYRIAK